MPADASFSYLFAGIAVADLAGETDWFSRLFGRPPDILPNADEAMWEATAAGSVYSRGIHAARIERVPAGRKLVLADPEGNEIGLAEIPL